MKKTIKECSKPGCTKPCSTYIYIKISDKERYCYGVHTGHIGWLSKVKISVEKAKGKEKKIKFLKDVGLWKNADTNK